MEKNSLLKFWWLVLNLALLPSLIFADGIIIPPPGVKIAVKYHRVMVTIENQIATTTIDQVFLNDSDVDNIEGIYIFPMPKGATFSSFSMFVDDQELQAEVLNADSARAIYESIVRKNLDPALLEYLDRGMFRARIYPIGAYSEKRVKISYTEVLSYNSEICRYHYPLSPEKFSSKPLKEVSIAIDLNSPDPIKSIYSPTHEITVNKIDDYSAKVIYADENVTPEHDFVLYYTVSTDDIGMHLLTHRPPSEDGFYLLMAAPKQQTEDSVILPKRILFVLDRSGSMAGDKIDQAKAALRFCLNSLNHQDWFNIVDFSSEVVKYSAECVRAEPSSISTALGYVDRLAAGGGTNINEALLTALADLAADSLINMIIFLTDGDPTVGITDNESICTNVRNANIYDARLFVFGVGYGVNTHLLDRLSDDNHGTSVYVEPGENIEVAVSNFFVKVNSPVLSNLSLDFGGITVLDYFPKELPDLFKGSQLIQFGRYSDYGGTVIALSGQVNGDQRNFTHETQFPPESSENAFIPRLWAIRKIGYLLDQIRLNGESQELIDEIVALAKRYGIITAYTSFLILEDEVNPGAFDYLAEESGAHAFNAAQDIRDYKDASNPASIQSLEIKYVGNKAFYRRSDFWVDSQYFEGQPTTVFEFGSQAYFDFLRKNPVMGQYFAIGKNVIVSVGEVAYQVQEQGANYEPVFPTRFSMSQNYPNPLLTNSRNSWTGINYQVPKPAAITIKVYNSLGQEIITLVNARKDAGIYRVWWNGRDFLGRQLPNGLYFYRLTVNGNQWVETKKMIISK